MEEFERVGEERVGHGKHEEFCHLVEGLQESLPIRRPCTIPSTVPAREEVRG